MSRSAGGRRAQVPDAKESKGGLHPRSRHEGRYNFSALIRCCPELAQFTQPSPTGDLTIDFAVPAAVKALNRALLGHHYGIVDWDVPSGCLCPPIPSRADYIHHVADLLAEPPRGPVPRGPAVRILDIGTGANCIFPLLGVREYGWRFVGTDTDPAAIAWAERLVARNPALRTAIEFRHQPSVASIFRGIAPPGENFSASMCNPPFHASADEAAAHATRKVRNLGLAGPGDPVLNFGGRANELWYPGGEVEFIRRMIAESADRRDLCRWFTTLVSKRDNLPAIERSLTRVRPAETRTIPLAHGQKKTRIVAWRFA